MWTCERKLETKLEASQYVGDICAPFAELCWNAPTDNTYVTYFPALLYLDILGSFEFLLILVYSCLFMFRKKR